MNALKNKPKPPRPYERLPEYQQKIINEYAVKLVEEIAKPREEAYIRQLLNLYIRESCVMLHDQFGMGESDLNQYIGAHKQFWRGQNRLVEKGTQDEYLEGRINEIFKGGFPQAFIDSLLDKVELVEGEEYGRNN